MLLKYTKAHVPKEKYRLKIVFCAFSDMINILNELFSFCYCCCCYSIAVFHKILLFFFLHFFIVMVAFIVRFSGTKKKPHLSIYRNGIKGIASLRWFTFQLDFRRSKISINSFKLVSINEERMPLSINFIPLTRWCT